MKPDNVLLQIKSTLPSSSPTNRGTLPKSDQESWGGEPAPGATLEVTAQVCDLGSAKELDRGEESMPYICSR